MQFFAVTLSLASAITSVLASPVTMESRQAATCPDWGTNIGGAPILGPTDSEASLCCVYGVSLAHCCRNKEFPADDSWSRALPCDSPYFESSEAFGPFYVCQVDPCREGCDQHPYVFDGPGCEQ
ncbi:hypothetical protein CC79DRAFT_1402135 [Sarocladium strictum]